uniref:glutaminase n=1 Tax=Globodera pallida TaxID=36090 RepID=A0A183CI39_GLOPA
MLLNRLHHICFVKASHFSSSVVPSTNWEKLIREIGLIYERCKKYEAGEVATYIPQLRNADPKLWAISLMTIDGKTASWGESKQKFCLQSVSKPFTYAIVLNDLGDDHVHRFVGQEPSGRSFNDICLDKNKKPHNPMINSGAIVVTSMVKPEWTNYKRFDFILERMRCFASGNELTFDNTTFLSECETGHQNYAIAHYLKQNNCYPANDDLSNDDLMELLKLYFMHCSIQTDTEVLANMAATLANGGIDPINQDRVISTKAVQNTLSVMFSCGMYDNSGQMAFKVGLPAKSGVSGNMVLVIPNVMGISLYSPRLDVYGNTVRGVKFAEKLVDTFRLMTFSLPIF